MQKYFFTSDTHYGHTNFCSGTTKWSDKSECRQFDTLQDMNDTLVDAINSVVGKNDFLYHAGDFAWGKKNVIEFRSRIICKNVFLAPGNHDKELMYSQELRKLFSSVYPGYGSIKVNNRHIILCHFAMRTWDRSHHGSWNLYGHSHGTLPELDTMLAMDIGCDTRYDFKPYSFEEIQDRMIKKTLIVTHHRKNIDNESDN